MAVSPSFLWGEEIVAAMSNWPPRKIIEGKEVTGIDADILREVAKRMNMKIKFKKCPWKRCQILIKGGEVDFITSIFKTAEREVFLHFIDPPYATKVTYPFYIRANSKVLIQKYEDLYKYKIGDVRGALSFPRYNKDTKIERHIVTYDKQLPKILIHKRIDAFIGQESQIDYIIKSGGYINITKSPYKNVSETSPSYMALSKNSKHVKLIPQFSKVMKQLIDEGKIEEIMGKYRL